MGEHLHPGRHATDRSHPFGFARRIVARRSRADASRRRQSDARHLRRTDLGHDRARHDPASAPDSAPSRPSRRTMTTRPAKILALAAISEGLPPTAPTTVAGLTSWPAQIHSVLG